MSGMHSVQCDLYTSDWASWLLCTSFQCMMTFSLKKLHACDNMTMTLSHDTVNLQIYLQQRTAQNGFLCPCQTGPVGHGWYVVLDQFARNRFRVGSASFIATKVVLDEGLFGPIHVLGFFAYMTLAEGGSWQVRLHPP